MEMAAVRFCMTDAEKINIDLIKLQMIIVYKLICYAWHI